MKKLEDLYETDVWAVIFKSLNLNPTIKRKYLYPEKNVIYIDELTDTEKEINKIAKKINTTTPQIGNNFPQTTLHKFNN